MGKVSSKPKKKKDPNNLSWASRFGSLPLRSKSRIHKVSTCSSPIITQIDDNKKNTNNGSTTTTKHIDTAQWLKSMDLEKYSDIFRGYLGVEDLLELSEADLKDMGVKISSHRAMMISNLTILRAKYHGNFTRKPSVRHSVAAIEKTTRGEEEDTLSDLNTVYEATTQSKSLNNLIMEPTADPTMNALELKKALEWELSLDSRDLRSHAWYHGAIPRSRAEEIVRDEDGCFLVRDCTSQPGNYVLTCRTKTQPLHFVINKIILQPDTVYEHVQWQFEEDAFDTVPDLITFYVGSGKPITVASGARIQYPRNRMYPLSFYASKYPTPLPQSRLTSPATTPIGNSHHHHFRHSNSLHHHPGSGGGGGRSSSSPTRTSSSGGGGAPRLPSRKQRSQSLTPSEVNRISQQEKCNSADGVILQQQSPLMTRSAGGGAADAIVNNNSGLKFSTHSLPRSPHAKLSLSPSSNTLGRNCRVTSDPTLSPCAERKILFNTNNENSCSDSGLSDSPPPKPSRVPSIHRLESCKESSDVIITTASTDGNTHSSRHSLDGTFPSHGGLQRVTSYHASGSDSGNGSGDSALSSAAGDPIETNQRNSGVIIKNPRYNSLVTSESSTTLKNFEFDYAEVEEKLMQSAQIEALVCSRFDLENFHTLLLPVGENKPLDAQALRGVKMILQESGPRILANHLTRTDLDVVFGKGIKDDLQDRLTNGIELSVLPHGQQFRMDLVERTECLKLLVAVTILTCQDDQERTEMLNKWIEIAIDTKTALGNLFGFCGIMLGLCLPQVERLDTTWHMLRQKYTDAAFNFEAKLRPTLKNMNSCSNPQAPNTTIPHLLPFILLMERTLDDFTQQTTTTTNYSSNSSTMDQQNQQQLYSLTSSCIGMWESNTQDFGLTTLLNHLETARKYMDSVATYRRNAEIVLGEARLDELTIDMFRTEFHLKFLWGSRGAHATAHDRHSKFEQLLTVMADKYCNGGNSRGGAAGAQPQQQQQQQQQQEQEASDV